MPRDFFARLNTFAVVMDSRPLSSTSGARRPTRKGLANLLPFLAAVRHGPVAALKGWIEAAGITEGAVFRRVFNRKAQRVTGRLRRAGLWCAQFEEWPCNQRSEAWRVASENLRPDSAQVNRDASHVLPRCRAVRRQCGCGPALRSARRLILRYPRIPVAMVLAGNNGSCRRLTHRQPPIAATRRLSQWPRHHCFLFHLVKSKTRQQSQPRL